MYLYVCTLVDLHIHVHIHVHVHVLSKCSETSERECVSFFVNPTRFSPRQYISAYTLYMYMYRPLHVLAFVHSQRHILRHACILYANLLYLSILIVAASIVHTTSTSPSHPYIQYTPPALDHHIHTFSTHHQH